MPAPLLSQRDLDFMLYELLDVEAMTARERYAGTMGTTEPGAGSGLADLTTSARPEGDGSYSLTGNKIFTSGGDSGVHSMFKFDPRSSYMMPAHFGPRPLSPKSSGWYRDVTSMTVPFLTDRDRLAAYLPEPFEVAEDAVVTVTYACNKQVDWLAGHGYNLVAVSAAAVFRGEQETLAGNYTLVMWENLTDPILTGRELQGIPKIYADIEDHSIIDGKWHTSASHFGHKIMDISASDLREPTPDEIAAYSQASEGKDNPMAWRYFPGISGFGQSISEPTTFPSATTLTQKLVGQGRVDWQQLTWEQNPTQFHIVNALADLPVVAWLPAIVAKGSTNLILPERLPRGIG